MQDLTRLPAPTRGEAFRREVAEHFEAADPAAEELLRQIVSTLNEIQAMERAVAEQGTTVLNARGAVAAHPNLVSLARHRALVARLLADAFPEARESQTEVARRAGRARWGR